MTKITHGDLQASHCGGIITTSGQLQSMRNLVCHRSMSGKTCPRLVEILGLSVTMTGNFFQFLLYIQWCDRSKLATTGKHLVSISQIVLWYENSSRIDYNWALDTRWMYDGETGLWKWRLLHNVVIVFGVNVFLLERWCWFSPMEVV